MAGTTPAALMQTWQACLAVAADRLARPDFDIPVQQTYDVDDDGPTEHCSLQARASGLRIDVLDAGLDLLRLTMRLQGTLQVGSRTLPLADVGWSVVAPFRVAAEGRRREVFADLAQAGRIQNVDTPTWGRFDRARLELGLAAWADAHAAERPFRLFAFDIGLGEGAAAVFDEFQVLSADAPGSPLPASLMVLMRDRRGRAPAARAAVDPHVLPQGQTAVLWLSRALLDADDANLADLAERELTLRPRPMAADIPRVSARLQAWAQRLVDHVSLPGGLAFTSMQSAGPAVMLSATPMSLDEFESLSATDPTLGEGDLVAAQAQQLLAECAVYHLDEGWRQQLLQMQRPVLASEVQKIAEPHQAWLREFACLQLARSIKTSDRAQHHPFERLSLEKVETLLQQSVRSETCRRLVERLYPLAFCRVQPRLSLYMEDAARWLPAWCGHLVSEAYIERLAALPEPVQKLHADNGKLNLLDPTGAAAAELLPQTTGLLLTHMAQAHWAPLLHARQERFETALRAMLEQLHEHPPADGGAELLATLEDCGGANGLTGLLMKQLLAASDRPQPAPLQQVAEGFSRTLQPLRPASAAALAHACLGAVLIVFVTETQAAGALDAGAVALQASTDALAAQLALAAVSLGALIGGLAKSHIGTLVMLSLKGVRFVADKIYGWTHSALDIALGVGGKLLRQAGAVLSAAAAVLTVIDAYDDFKAGHAVAGVIDVMQTAVALLGVWALLSSASGPAAPILFVVGLVLTGIRLLVLYGRSPQEKASTEFTEELERLGAGA